MQFKTKLLLTRLIIFLMFMMLMLWSYHTAVSQFSKQMNADISREIAIKQQNISNIIAIAKQNKQQNFGFYYQVHKKALNLYKASPDKSLEGIRQELIKQFGVSEDSLDLYLINPDKVIYDSTLAKDIGYDLSKFAESVQMIDNAFADDDIHISKSVSQDVLDGSYKTFSYAKADDGVILELSFVDDSASKVFRLLQRQDVNQHIQATLYNVYNEDNRYIYFLEGDGSTSKNKKEAYEHAPKFNQSNFQSDPIISAFLTGKPVSFEDKDERLLYYYANLFPEPNLETEFDNIVVKYEVSLQERELFLQSIKRFFLIVFAFIAVIMWGVHLLFKNELVKPVDLITNHIRNRELIPIDKLNNQSDEFHIIAKEYNHVYSELNKEIEKNAKKVYIDSLTQAGNRQAFDEKLEQLITEFEKNQRHFTMMLFDIDEFKKVNDNFGHLTGDKVLKAISVLVKDTIRDRDNFYRVGGEEFVVLLAETGLNDAIEVAKKVRQKIASHFADWDTGEITISAGVCQMSTGNTYESLYKCADDMLYQAKADGKNRVYYNSGCLNNK